MQKKERQSLESILASVSDVLYPDKMGTAKVAVDSVDCVGDTPLHVLAGRPNVYGAGLLLEEGADPNAVGDMGETPLHRAVSAGSEDMVRLLLRYDADSSVSCEFGDTPKDRAQARSKKLARLFAPGSC